MRRLLIKLWPVAVVFVAWEAVVRLFHIPAYILPPPDKVVTRMFVDRSLLLQHGMVSVFEILVGFLLAAMGGFMLAVLIVYSRRLEQLFEPFLVVSQVVPKVALAPLFIIWFGHGLLPKVIIAATIAFFPVLVNTVLGLKSVDREVIEMMNSIAAGRRQIFLRVRLPNCLPYLLPSLKVAVLLSVVGAMVGEFVGADKGLGYLMVVGDVNLDTELLFAALIVVTLVGLMLYSGVGVVERRVGLRYGSGDLLQLTTL